MQAQHKCPANVQPVMKACAVLCPRGRGCQFQHQRRGKQSIMKCNPGIACIAWHLPYVKQQPLCEVPWSANRHAHMKEIT
eukprot:616342-Pelagomonas_calceolata.AAC.1